jgi:hypothetical protein
MAKFSSDNQPANRGRPKGSANKSTQLIRKATPRILNSLINSAVNGDIQAATAVLKYSMPPIRGESARITINVPEKATLSEKAELITNAALTGKCCPSVASQLISALSQVSKIKEIDEILTRLTRLENA